MKRIVIPELDARTPRPLEQAEESLKLLEEGFGYYGALSMTPDGKKVQCHICGILYMSLEAHVRQTHHMVPVDYRTKYGLSPTTALISEKEKEKRGKIMRKRWKELGGKKQKEIRKKTKIGHDAWVKSGSPRSHVQPKLSYEEKNKRGTTPEQVLAHVQELTDTMSRPPSLRDLLIYDKGSQRYKHLVFQEFGSWSKALELIGLKPRVPDLSKKPPRVSTNSLIENLKFFYERNGRVPTEADSKRKLIPASEIYVRRFGSLQKARKLAGIPEEVNRYNNQPKKRKK